LEKSEKVEIYKVLALGDSGISKDRESTRKVAKVHPIWAGFSIRTTHKFEGKWIIFEGLPFGRVDLGRSGAWKNVRHHIEARI